MVDAVTGSGLAEPSRDYQVRNTIEALVRTPEGNDVRVLSGHYEWPNERYDHQELQVGAIARGLSAWKGATILGGDFNVRATSGNGADERAMLAGPGLRDTGIDPETGERVNRTDPGGGIDRIYASSHARVVSAHVAVHAGDASDHLPFVTELELEPPD